jgi:hypothetical protein
MPTRVINDNRMWDAMCLQLPRSEGGTLVARARFIDPNVNGYTGIVGFEYWR